MRRWGSRRLVSGLKSSLGVGLCELGRWERVGCIWPPYVNNLQYLGSERVMHISMSWSMHFGFGKFQRNLTTGTLETLNLALLRQLLVCSD